MENETKVEKKKKVAFYVGAESLELEGPYMKTSKADAIATAQKLLSDNPKRKQALIVKVVAVVRPKPVAVDVEHL